MPDGGLGTEWSQHHCGCIQLRALGCHWGPGGGEDSTLLSLGGAGRREDVSGVRLGTDSRVWKVWVGMPQVAGGFPLLVVGREGSHLGSGPVCHQLTEGKMMERRKKIALELSELVVYCRPVPFDEESKGLAQGQCGGLAPSSARVGGLCERSPCLAQRSAQNAPATGTCRPSRKPRLRST